MSGVNSNDQLLKHSHFSLRTIKWRKKVFFRMFNVCMVNAFIIRKEYNNNNGTSKVMSHTEFRIAVFRQLVNKSKANKDLNLSMNKSMAEEFQRLSGRQFISKIQDLVFFGRNESLLFHHKNKSSGLYTSFLLFGKVCH